jgi:hypothetical protein
MTERLKSLSIVAVLLLAPALPVQAAEAPAGFYHYLVRHPTFGVIGSFTNAVTNRPGETRVSTELHIRVSAAIITLKSIEARREELWRDGRLAAYRSVTDRDGRQIAVEGRADGDKFIVSGPHGTAEAPRDVYPSNPWSMAITQAHVFMAGESGRLYRANFVEAPAQRVMLGGRPVPARHFSADAPAQPQLWYAEGGVLVQFSIVEDGTEILFTLDDLRMAGG